MSDSDKKGKLRPLRPDSQPVSSATFATEATLLKTVGLGVPQWDYTALVQASTTDTWAFKTGGSGGSTVATVVITYTDSGKGTISNITKT